MALSAVAVIAGAAAAIVAVALPSGQTSTVAMVTVARAATHTTAPKHTALPPSPQTVPTSDPSQPKPSDSDHLARCGVEQQDPERVRGDTRVPWMCFRYFVPGVARRQGQ